MRFDNRRGEHGFALILALLTLMLLTFLGLTLAATTSSELQIASNQRWAAQAYYNAEAGIEAAKIALKNYTGSLDLIPLLPNARGAWVPNPLTTVALPAHPNGWSDTTDSWGLPLRNWENSTCDTLGGNVGYGTILVARPSVDVNLAAGGAPLQYVTQVGNLPLQGAFTVWVRRAPVINPDGSVSDDTSNTEALVTSEGVAPYSGASAGSAFALRNRAVRVLQAKLSILAEPPCEAQRGQIGMSSTGSGFSPCSLLTSSALADEFGGGVNGPAGFGVAAR